MRSLTVSFGKGDKAAITAVKALSWEQLATALTTEPPESEDKARQPSTRPPSATRPHVGATATKRRSKKMFKSGWYWIGDPCYTMFEGYTWQHSTFIGDGIYYDQKGRQYCVDSGQIGICVADVVREKDEGGWFIEFKKDFACSYKEGVFRFGSVRIDTRV